MHKKDGYINNGPVELSKASGIFKLCLKQKKKNNRQMTENNLWEYLGCPQH